MASTLITAYLGQGLAANRPATPLIVTGSIGFYFATDTGILSVYENGGWSNVGGAASTQIGASQSLSGVNNFTFSSIPSTYKDLTLVIRGRSDGAVTSTNVQLQFNGDTGSNYDYQQENRFGRGTANGTTFAAMGAIAGASATANYDTGLEIDIFNYAGTTFFKNAKCYQELLVSQTDAGMLEQTTGGWWRSTAAINSIKGTLASGNFVTGSVVSLYGRNG